MSTRTALATTLAVASLAGGCNLVLGIGELSHRGSGGSGGTGGAASSSSSSSSSATGGGGTGGTGGQAPCQHNADCTTPGTACVNGACVTPSCAGSAIVDVLVPADVSGHDLDESLVVTADGSNAYVAVRDVVANALVVRHLHGGNGTPGAIATFACNVYCDFSRARVSVTEVAFQGQVGGTVGEVVFARAGDGSLSNPTFSPFPTPAPCTVSFGSTRVELAELGGVAKYAVSCDDAQMNRTLYVGGADEPTPTQIASGKSTDSNLRLNGYAVTPGLRLLALGQSQAFWRGGTQSSDLMTEHVFQLSSDPNVLSVIDGLVPRSDAGGIVLLGGQFVQTPLSGSYWSGTIQDVSAFSTAPPVGLEQTPIDAATVFSRFGKVSRVWSDASGLYQAIAAQDAAHVALHWFQPSGQALILGAPIYEVPDPDATAVVSAGVTRIELKLLVAWLENKGGALTVRARPVLCQD